jgi:hypothetical protein
LKHQGTTCPSTPLPIQENLKLQLPSYFQKSDDGSGCGGGSVFFYHLYAEFLQLYT